MLAKPTMFALGLVLSAAVAAVVLARPERVPASLAPPPRSAAANAPERQVSSDAIEETSDPTPDDPPPKGYALNRQDLDMALARVHGRAMACRSEGVPTVVPVHLVVSPAGSVTSVGLPAELRGTRGGDCISHAMHAMSFPAWHVLPNVPNVEWNYPLRFDTGE
jgi:hypothetical protein